MTKKVASIAYVEDTQKHHGIIARAAKSATSKAVKKARAASLPITYLEGKQIIKESSSGRKKILGTVENRRKVKVGSKATIS